MAGGVAPCQNVRSNPTHNHSGRIARGPNRRHPYNPATPHIRMADHHPLDRRANLGIRPRRVRPTECCQSCSLCDSPKRVIDTPVVPEEKKLSSPNE